MKKLMEADEENTKKNEGHKRVTYPKNDKSLVEFLHRYQKKNFEVCCALDVVLCSTGRLLKIWKEFKYPVTGETGRIPKDNTS